MRDGRIVDNPFMNRSLQWDIFCKVIDNFGDIGVCWRLAADLASRGHRVRLWVDDASALAWMAPDGCKNVQVIPWTEPLDLTRANLALHPADVLIESFGCEIAPEFIAYSAEQASATGIKPVWVNLEYLSAEPYVERCHALPSQVRHGPAAGWTKWFFYPGFNNLTGGLLREPGLLERQARFDCSAWLATQGIAPAGEKRVSLFCYEPPALNGLLTQLSQQGLDGAPVRLLVTAGRAQKAVKNFFNDKTSLVRNQSANSLLSISYLGYLAQADFDPLLWACDLNFVRGEDSLVRALWSGKPFVWQLYPQMDNAHLPKLDAFLGMLEAPPSLQRIHQAWNAADSVHGPVKLSLPDLAAWQNCAVAARSRLMAREDLGSRLIGFVAKKR